MACEIKALSQPFPRIHNDLYSSICSKLIEMINYRLKGLGVYLFSITISSKVGQHCIVFLAIYSLILYISCPHSATLILISNPSTKMLETISKTYVKNHNKSLSTKPKNQNA